MVGWIFLNYRNSLDDLSDNTVIYGYNRKDNNMFRSLENTLKDIWYSDISNHIIRLSNSTENSILRVISVYVIKKGVLLYIHLF